MVPQYSQNRAEQIMSPMDQTTIPSATMSAAADIAGKKAAVLTVQGERLSVDARRGVKVDKAKVVAADVEASNGVIHVIPGVLVP